MSSTELRLGPFVLRERIAHGGFGEIWRAEHDRQRVPVAIKVVRGAAGAPADRFVQFHREVRAVAQLNHPNIVSLFDYGAVPPEAAQRSQGRLEAGTPYLAMEFASAGSLDRVIAAPLTWEHVRRVLLSVLEALAHAHARGIVHRDIKPQNILLPGPTDLRPTLRLADFGIAQAFERTGADVASTAAEFGEGGVGSPAYMSPEQCMSQWRDHGPWTDLYALGIVAWELIAGRTPFEGASVMSIALRHVREPLPYLQPRFEVPQAIHTWIARMTAKAPRDRFRHARDAAWALLQLDRAALTGPRVSDADLFLFDLDQVDLGATVGAIPDLDATMPVSYEVRVRASRSASAPRNRPPPLPDAQPPLAETWGLIDEQQQPPLPFVDVGVGLFGMRRPAVVGRESERDLLWAALRRVHDRRACQVVMLRGGTGTGKSRLAAWISHVGAEAGGAQIMVANHEAGGGATSGLVPMLVDFFRCTGLDAARMGARLDDVLAPDEVPEHERRALGTLMAEHASDADPSRSQASALERLNVVRRALRRASAERPLLLWLDDVHYATETVALVQHLLERDAQEPLAALVVMTVRPDAVDASDGATRLLNALSTHAAVETIDLGRLPDEHMDRLLERMLRLSPPLAQQVTSRSDGIPMFAVELVSDWVHRALLRVGSDGFELAPGVTPELPDSLHELWSDRTAAELSHADDELRELARLAATLGVRVDLQELRDAWRVLAHAEIDPAAALLAAPALCALEGDALVFAHPMLRESLVRGAREAGTLPALHSACADMLAPRQGRGAPVASARRARHLIAAGRADEAAEPLRIAARGWIERSAFDEARARATELRHLADRLPDPDADRARCDAALALADVHRLQWGFDLAGAAADEALELGRRIGDQARIAQALARQANVARQQGDPDRARTCNEEALALFRAAGDADGAATTRMSVAILARVSGDATTAEASYRAALAEYEGQGNARGVGNCVLGLGHLYRGLGQLDRARSCYLTALETFERLEDRAERANAVNGLAEVARMEGQVEEAARRYLEALEMQEAVGSRNSSVTHLNLAILEVDAGHFACAGVRLAQLDDQMRAFGQLGFLPYVHVFSLAVAAGLRDRALWDAHVDAAREGLAAGSLVDPDLATMADRAAGLAAIAGWDDRARAAASLAAAQYRALSRLDDAVRVTDEHGAA